MVRRLPGLITCAVLLCAIGPFTCVPAMDVKDENGSLTNWEVELAAPAILIRRGWTRTAIKIGDPVTVTGALAKDGSNLINGTSVTLGDGTKVFSP